MSDHPGDEAPDERQRRLDALRGLAREAAPVTPDAPAIAPSSLPALPAARPLRRRWRRWLAPASALVIVLVVVGVVVGAILRQSRAPGSHPAPALAGKAYSLGALSCPSTPAWSPDGKSLALLVTPQANLSGCWNLNQMTSIAESNPAVNGNQTSGMPPDVFAIAIVDAATGHVTRTITLPALSKTVLCVGAVKLCSYSPASPVSVGWSPDGKTVAAFFTYTFDYSDNTHSQDRGVLVVAAADGSGAPRMLIANGHVRYTPAVGGFSSDAVWGPPRFTWDLTKDTGSYFSVHRSIVDFSTPFAQGYQFGANGALTLDQQAQAGDVSPWREGVLANTLGAGRTPPVYSWQSSQWLWSADGRYVTPNLDTAAYVTLSGATGAPPAPESGFVNQSSVSAPDAATSQSLQAAAQGAVSAAMARNPNGKLLATYMCGVSAGELTIRAVKSGATLAQTSYTYPLSSTSLGCTGGIGAITWSPDGARIATVDAPDSQLIIWRVNLHS
ncbi:MAG: PD40 domain-containing protein [Chloroflexota bacterium]|nr:PD40 domain-containing protein [Chloroflexota bacterium]